MTEVKKTTESMETVKLNEQSIARQTTPPTPQSSNPPGQIQVHKRVLLFIVLTFVLLSIVGLAVTHSIIKHNTRSTTKNISQYSITSESKISGFELQLTNKEGLLVYLQKYNFLYPLYVRYLPAPPNFIQVKNINFVLTPKEQLYEPVYGTDNKIIFSYGEEYNSDSKTLTINLYLSSQKIKDLQSKHISLSRVVNNYFGTFIHELILMNKNPVISDTDYNEAVKLGQDFVSKQFFEVK